MPDQEKGFLSGWKGNLAQRALRAAADFVMPGNQRGADGTLTGEGKGLAGLALKLGASAVGGPGLGALVGKAYGNYTDNGTLIPYGGGPLAQLMGYGNKVGPVTRQQIGFPSNEVGQYTMAQPAMNMPTMPAVQAQAPWTGSLAQSNPFGGSYGGNLGFGGGNRPIGGNLSYGGGRAGYNNGAGAGTGFGGASFANDSWGDVASSFGVGSSSMGSRMPDMIARYSRV